jgi:hypothetical protein
MKRQLIEAPPYPRSNKQWSLPEVVGVQAARVRYSEPKIRFVGRKMTEWREAVELLVRTAGEFPVRAISPALFIGDQMISDYEPAGINQYRFFAFDLEKLKEGAPIYIGWPQFPATKRNTRFSFKITGARQA